MRRPTWSNLLLVLALICLAQIVVKAEERVSNAGGDSGSTAGARELAPPVAAIDPVEKKLDEARIVVEFHDSPLQDVCAFLSETLGVDIVFDRGSLDRHGIDIDSPITLKISRSDASVRTVLELCLAQVATELVAKPKDGLLIITTEDQAYVTEAYNISKLLSADPKRPITAASAVQMLGGGKAGGGLMIGDAGISELTVPAPAAEAESLRNFIVAAILPLSWDEQGGEASISVFRELLVVKQTPQAQREIRELLKKMEAAQAADPHSAGTVVQPSAR